MLLLLAFTNFNFRIMVNLQMYEYLLSYNELFYLLFSYYRKPLS